MNNGDLIESIFEHGFAVISNRGRPVVKLRRKPIKERARRCKNYYFHGVYKKYYVMVTHKYKNIFLGYFDRECDAKLIADIATGRTILANI